MKLLISLLVFSSLSLPSVQVKQQDKLYVVYWSCLPETRDGGGCVCANELYTLHKIEKNMWANATFCKQKANEANNLTIISCAKQQIKINLNNAIAISELDLTSPRAN